MKIGGLTWWRNNYGSILQAYALQKYLTDVENADYTIINQYSKRIASFDNLVDKLRTIGLHKTIFRLIGRFGLRKIRKRVASLQRFVDERLITTEEIFNDNNIERTNQLFDGFICGSDQIWNPSNTELDSIYWLRFASEDKFKIAYAPSIGIHEATQEQKTEIRKSLLSFDAISAREQTGTELINGIMGTDACITVLDPTMLVDRTVWDELSESRLSEGAYIFAYMLRGTKRERKLVEAFAREKQLPIVTIPFLDSDSPVIYDFRFGDRKLWDASPEEFISAVRHAEYVFTDSFHCMVFSCLYRRTFFTFPKKGKNQLSRIVGLQELLQIKSRMITADTSLDQIDNMCTVDWKVVDSSLLTEKERSRKFIRYALIRVGDENKC